MVSVAVALKGCASVRHVSGVTKQTSSGPFRFSLWYRAVNEAPTVNWTRASLARSSASSARDRWTAAWATSGRCACASLIASPRERLRGADPGPDLAAGPTESPKNRTETKILGLRFRRRHERTQL